MYGMNKPYTWIPVKDDGWGTKQTATPTKLIGRIQNNRIMTAQYEAMNFRGTTNAYLVTPDTHDYKLGDFIHDDTLGYKYTVVGINQQLNIFGTSILYVRLDLQINNSK